jgi:signal transduction histidine kinase
MQFPLPHLISTPRALTPVGQRLAVFGPAAIALVLGAGVLASLTRARAGRDQVAHTHEVIATLDRVMLRFVDAETGVRGYFITGDSTYLVPYAHAEADVRNGLGRLRALTIDNPLAQRRLDTLESLTPIRFAMLDSGVAARQIKRSGLVSAPPVTPRGKAAMAEIRRIITAFGNNEQQLLEERSAMEASRTQLVIVLVVLSSVIAALLALVTNGRLSRFASAQAGMAQELTGKNATLFEQANDLAVANQAKMQFLTAMSHELRTPLNAIDGYAQLLEMAVRGPITAEQASDLGRIRRNGRYLAGLINDILNYAKLEAGRVDLRMSAMPLNETLAAIESLIAPQASAKGITYHYVPCDPALTISGDAERVQQVVINLVTNAIKFTDAGGMVTVAADADDSYARIRVVDTGRGIPADKLGIIFDPFVQVDRRLTASALQGAGLGLAISRDLVVKMGGAITVDSVVGEGSTFCVKLRRVAHDATELSTLGQGSALELAELGGSAASAP